MQHRIATKDGVIIWFTFKELSFFISIYVYNLWLILISIFCYSVEKCQKSIRRDKLVTLPSPLKQNLLHYISVGAQAMPFSLFELPLVRLAVFIDHNSIADFIQLKSAFEGGSLFESIKPVNLLIIFPLSSKLISVWVFIGSIPVSLSIFYGTLIVLYL